MYLVQMHIVKLKKSDYKIIGRNFELSTSFFV